jgi:hypothetical protein
MRAEDLQAADCQGKWAPAAAPVATWAEVLIHRQWELALEDLSADRIAHSSVMLPGVHGSNNHRVFAEYIVPAANQHFAEAPTPPPATFTYRSALPVFSVWGYRVEVSRGRDGFCALTDAATDGRRYRLAGTGDVAVLSPPSFRPGHSYLVTSQQRGRGAEVRRLRADPEGRLRITTHLVGDDEPVTLSVGGG